jgi:hypothetical protein
VEYRQAVLQCQIRICVDNERIARSTWPAQGRLLEAGAEPASAK